MSDMYFDPKSFDFNDLKDVVEVDQADLRRVEKNNPNDDMSDLFPNKRNYDSNGYESESDENEDFNDDASDLDRPEERVIHLRDAFETAGDDVELDLGLEHRLTKAQIKELAKAKAKLETDSGYFAEQAAKFDADNRAIMQRGLMQQTQLEHKAAILQQRLQNTNISDSDYAQASRDLQIVNSAMQQLNTDVNQIMQTRAAQEAEINGYRIRMTDEALATKFPQYREQKADIVNYAVNEAGIPASVLEKTYSEGLITALMKARAYDNNKKRIAEQVTSTAQHARSTKGAKQNTRSNTNSFDETKKKEAFKGFGTKQGHVKAFDYLTD